MLDLADFDSTCLPVLQRKYMLLLGPIDPHKSGKLTVRANVVAHYCFLLLQRMSCFHEGLIAESDSDSRQHLSIRSGNKMYPLLGPLTRDIVCRLHQFVAAGRTSISAKMTKRKLLFSTAAATRPL